MERVSTYPGRSLRVPGKLTIFDVLSSKPPSGQASGTGTDQAGGVELLSQLFGL